MTDTAQQKARKGYEEKRVTKRVSFNTETEAELLDKINLIQTETNLSFSEWVKAKIQEY